jgi:hypothetical protein
MKSPAFFLLLISLLGSSTFALAATAPQFDQLKGELDKFTAKLKPEQRTRYGEGTGFYLQGIVTKAAADFDQGNYESADQALRQLPQVASTPEIDKLVNDLLTVIQAAKEKRDRATVEKIEALVTRTGDLCLHAKTEKELDPLLSELGEARTSLSRGGGNEVLQRALQKLDSAATFTRQWQDYLAQLHAGNQQAAAAIIMGLTNNNFSYPIVARSELLDRARSVQADAAVNAPAPKAVPAETIVFDLKSLDDVPAAMQSLQGYIQRNPQLGRAQGVLINLRFVQEGVDSLANGNLGGALLIGTTNPVGGSNQDVADMLAFTRLRSELLLRILPRYLVVSAPQLPHPNENPSDYLLRMVAEGKAASDWKLVMRALEAYRRVAYASPSTAEPSWLGGDMVALSNFLIAQNLERSGDEIGAISTYQVALRQSGQNFPVDEITVRIKALRQAIDAEQAARQARLQAQVLDRSRANAPVAVPSN